MGATKNGRRVCVMSRDNANNNGKKTQPGNSQDSEVAESKKEKNTNNKSNNS